MADLRLVKSQFKEAKDIGGGFLSTGCLAEMKAVSAMISQLSIASSGQVGAFLLNARRSVLEVRGCSVKDVRGGCGKFWPVQLFSPQIHFKTVTIRWRSRVQTISMGHLKTKQQLFENMG